VAVLDTTVQESIMGQINRVSDDLRVFRNEEVFIPIGLSTENFIHMSFKI
jgi:hypothetical protein